MTLVAVRWSRSAERDLHRLDREDQRRVLGVISRFAETREGDVKRLQGPFGSEFRLRSGHLRIRFEIAADGAIVMLRILPRDKAYK